MVRWRVKAVGALLLASALVWGCASPQPPERRFTVPPVPAREIIKAALSQRGKSYAYGGRSPRTGFDCSGLVYWCYLRCGSHMPRTVRDQYRVGVAVARRDLQAGDLVFFATATFGSQPSHVGIMLDHYRFIHAPASGQYVREDELRNNYWNHAYYGARRVE